MRRWLVAESSLATALLNTPGVLSEADTLAIACATETDTLPETLSYLLEQRERNANQNALLATQDDAGIYASISYITLTFFGVSLVLLFFMVRIAPMLESVFSEFEIALPLAMSSLIDFTNRYVWLIAAVLIGGIILFIALQFEDIQRIFSRSWLGRRLTFYHQQRSADLLQLFAIASRHHQPLEFVLTAAAKQHPDSGFRNSLLMIRTQSSSESSIWERLAEKRLLTQNDANQLVRIGDPSLLSMSLQYIADQRRASAATSISYILQAGKYLPILLLSLLIGWVVVAVTQTLTGMVTSLA